MLPQVAKLNGIALGLLFPRQCEGCGKGGNFVYSSRRRSLSRIVPPFHPHCGKPQPGGILCPGRVNWQAEIDDTRPPFRLSVPLHQKRLRERDYNQSRLLAQELG